MDEEQDNALAYLNTSLSNAGVDTSDIDPKEKPAQVEHVLTEEDIAAQEKAALK